MPDNLAKAFKDNLYPKQKDRNWERCADKYGDELVAELQDMFPYPEQALCATVHALASLVMQAKKEHRGMLVDILSGAVKDRLVLLEEDEEDMGPGEEDEEEELENEDDVDFDASGSVPERPSPEPDEDDDGDGVGDDDPNESFFNNPKQPPTRQSGFQPKRRPEGK